MEAVDGPIQEGGVMKRYLGDSVYAEFDGYQINLTTENGLPDDPSNRISLEPEVMGRLVVMVNDITSFKAAAKG